MKTGRAALAARWLPLPIRQILRRLAGRPEHSRIILRRARARRAASHNPSPDVLTPLLVDYYARDGSTLMMRLLSTSPEIAVERTYPYEAKYFSYLWRWSRLLDRRDWPVAEWGAQAFGSMLQEDETPLMGAPPWHQRELLAGAPREATMGRRCFDGAWREFSRRATIATRVEHRRPAGDVAYYAEKHMNSWQLDLEGLPPLQLLVLLRDPRDTYVSITSFNLSNGRDLGRMNSMTEEEFVNEFIKRQRQRLRWVAGLLDENRVPVIRYDELVGDLPGVASRVGRLLEVRLDAEAVASDRRMRRMHATTATPEQSVGRWKSELQPAIAERINADLGSELRAVGVPD